jgi:hypothetical protein
MIQVKCINKIRIGNKIIEYIITDINGNIKSVKPDQLKKAIKQKDINIVNLKLTSDDRLIDKNYVENEFVIMNKDKYVASFNSNLGNLIIYNKLPYGFTTLAGWIESRQKFSCARDVKTFFKSIGINTEIDFIDIIHCVSLHDTFWVKRIDDKTKWQDISPYTHNYSEIISTYALDGIILNNNSKNYFSPVMETNGSFPHTWKWNNGQIYFIKAGSKYTLPASNSGREPYSEYYASIIAKYLNFDAVDYKIRRHKRHDGKVDIVTECKIFTDESRGTTTANNLGLISYEDVIKYCKKLSEKSYNTILNMLFLDCLLLNTDRHFSNIEFYVDNDTQKVMDITPIFDNNFSMLPRFIEDFDTFERDEYKARDGRTFEEVYKLITKHKKFNNELIKLKNLKLCKPSSVPITDGRLKFLNKFLQWQINYLLSL